MFFIRVWSLGETRLQLSVRNSRDELQPPPPPSRKPSIRHLEQEVCLCVVQDSDKQLLHVMHFWHWEHTMWFKDIYKPHFTVRQSKMRCASHECSQFPFVFICVLKPDTLCIHAAGISVTAERYSAFPVWCDSNFTGNKGGRKHCCTNLSFHTFCSFQIKLTQQIPPNIFHTKTVFIFSLISFR